MSSDEDESPFMSSQDSADNVGFVHRRKRDRAYSFAKLAGVSLIATGVVALLLGSLGASVDTSEGATETDEEAEQRNEVPHGGPGGDGRGMLRLDMDINSNSCRQTGRCGRRISDFPCQCDGACPARGDCCTDWHDACTSYHARDPSLMRPSSAPTYTFYVYRGQSEESYAPLNANAASLGGVLWYLQNEVVNRCDSGRGTGEFGYRRFKITRILRFKITVKAPEPLYRRGMNFGTRVAFDSGKNTGSWEPYKDMKVQYEKYGYNVGCNILGKGPYPLCPATSGEGYCPITYANAAWYSLPGPCPSQDIMHKSSRCQSKEPGGYCNGKPTGQGNCTWTYEDAGWINIDELVGITPRFSSHYEFCRRGCLEYMKYGSPRSRDKGRCVSWWDHRYDKNKNDERMRKADEAFKSARRISLEARASTSAQCCENRESTAYALAVLLTWGAARFVSGGAAKYMFGLLSLFRGIRSKYPRMPSDAELPPPRCDFNKNAFYHNL